MVLNHLHMMASYLILDTLNAKRLEAKTAFLRNKN